MAEPPLTPLRNALTGATFSLPAEEAPRYKYHLAETYKTLQPADHRETLLVQSIVDHEWRMQKIPVLIESILALGRTRHAAEFQDNTMLLEAHVHLTYAREIRSLSLQENRLHRQRDKDMAELKDMQSERRRKYEEQLEAAAKMHIRFEEEQDPFDPAEFGFEFSIEEIEERVGMHEAKRIGCEYPKQFAKYIHAKLLRDERLGLLPADEEDEEEAA